MKRTKLKRKNAYRKRRLQREKETIKEMKKNKKKAGS